MNRRNWPRVMLGTGRIRVSSLSVGHKAQGAEKTLLSALQERHATTKPDFPRGRISVIVYARIGLSLYSFLIWLEKY